MLDHLPRDIINDIKDRLPVEDALKISQLNKHLYNNDNYSQKIFLMRKKNFNLLVEFNMIGDIKLNDVILDELSLNNFINSRNSSTLNVRDSRIINELTGILNKSGFTIIDSNYTRWTDSTSNVYRSKNATVYITEQYIRTEFIQDNGNIIRNEISIKASLDDLLNFTNKFITYSDNYYVVRDGKLIKFRFNYNHRNFYLLFGYLINNNDVLKSIYYFLTVYQTLLTSLFFEETPEFFLYAGHSILYSRYIIQRVASNEGLMEKSINFKTYIREYLIKFRQILEKNNIHTYSDKLIPYEIINLILPLEKITFKYR